ncbi:FHS family L-fucose permease-like MFS transporter [Spirosoma lacussanchae]|uniref:L-fucose:H+ symporter permease n=1 Tax=Spirosoma lacussanchae TaxID=1884249 RepID=UPI001FE7E9F7|nr:L-fucose:H+ symporter permease [Spirosoma lacussanchae]
MKLTSNVVPLLVVMGLMFVWNLCRNINDILIPHLKRACQLTDFESSLVQSAFFGAYFLMAIPVGEFLRRYSYKAGMLMGLSLAALGAFLFYPAAETRLYPLFLGALFVMATGFTFLEVTATPYVSILGKPDDAPSRLSLASAVGSFGATLGPLLGAGLLLSADDIPAAGLVRTQQDLVAFLEYESGLVKAPYLILGVFFSLATLSLYFIRLPAVSQTNQHNLQIRRLLRFRHTRLGAIGVFCYLGAEVGIVSFLIRYAKTQQLPGLTEQKAAFFISLFMALVLLGRLLGSWLLQQVRPPMLLTFCSLSAAGLVGLGIMTTGWLALLALASVGLFTSVVYPILFTLSISELGPYTKLGSSLLIMSIVGGAIVPPLMGLLSDAYGIRVAFAVPVICYLYLVFYGTNGYLVLAHPDKPANKPVTATL